FLALTTHFSSTTTLPSLWHAILSGLVATVAMGCCLGISFPPQVILPLTVPHWFPWASAASLSPKRSSVNADRARAEAIRPVISCLLFSHLRAAAAPSNG